jgi:hypothetical protein
MSHISTRSTNRGSVPPVPRDHQAEEDLGGLQHPIVPRADPNADPNAILLNQFDPAAYQQQLLLNARAARDLQSQTAKVDKVVSYLRSLTGEITLDSPEMIKFQLSGLEMNQVLIKFAANPNIINEGAGTTQLMDAVVCLGTQISKDNAKDFVNWSNKFPQTPVKMESIVNAKAKQHIDFVFRQKGKHVGMSEDMISSWYTTWDHWDLAHWVEIIFGRKDQNIHTTIEQEFDSFKLDMKSDQLWYDNSEGEQDKINEIYAILGRYPEHVVNNEKLQQHLFNKLYKKIPKENPFQKRLVEMFSDTVLWPNKTVQNWMDAFSEAREDARRAINTAMLYGATGPPLPSQSRIPKKDENERQRNRHLDQKHDQKHGGTRDPRDIFLYKKGTYDESRHCYRCGLNNHMSDKCTNPNPDCNEEKIPFHLSAKGKQWMLNIKLGPFVHRKFLLNGQAFIVSKPDTGKGAGVYGPGAQDTSTCKYTQMLLTSITNRDENVLIDLNDNITNNSDFLTVQISLPSYQMPQKAVEEGGERTRKRTKAVTENAQNTKCSALALLDSGCLIGDCMSQKIVDMLDASHLIVYTNTTICSGFDNNCSSRFPTLLINISYFNEQTSLLENFHTRVFILPKTPIELIIGRKTIKQQQFSKTAPSHFQDQINLNVSTNMTTGSFGDTISQELYSATPLNQAKSKGSPFKTHAHTCNKSNLKSDDEVVGFRGLTGKRKSVKQDTSNIDGDPLCLSSKVLPQGSCRDGGSCPCSLQQSPGDQMDVSGADGLNDNPLLAPVLESDNPPLPLGGVPGKTRDLSKKWLLQEDGSYLPVFSEKSAHPFVSSMIPISNDKPVDSRPGVFQTWGIIATLIKQQDQAECSTTVARQRTVDNSQDAIENNHDTISAFIDNNEEIMSEENSQDDDFDDTLDTEHDVFNDFINQGDDPSTDPLDRGFTRAP